MRSFKINQYSILHDIINSKLMFVNVTSRFSKKKKKKKENKENKLKRIE